MSYPHDPSPEPTPKTLAFDLQLASSYRNRALGRLASDAEADTLYIAKLSRPNPYVQMVLADALARLKQAGGPAPRLRSVLLPPEDGAPDDDPFTIRLPGIRLEDI